MEKIKYFITVVNEFNEFCSSYHEGTDEQEAIESFNEAALTYTRSNHKFTSIEEISRHHIPLPCNCCISLDVAEIKMHETEVILFINGDETDKLETDKLEPDEEFDESKVDVVFEDAEFRLTYEGE